VKSFLKNHANNYPIEIVYCGGDPGLVLMDKEGNEIEDHYLEDLNEEEICKLIESKGFKKIE
jgi:hypothetical protein